MNNEELSPMLGKYIEAYDVVRTVEVVAEGKGTYRVEVVNSLKGGGAKPFETRYLMLVDGTWRHHPAGYVRATNADEALRQGLGFLAMSLTDFTPPPKEKA